MSKRPPEAYTPVKMTQAEIESVYKPSTAAADILRQLHAAQAETEKRESLLSQILPVKKMKRAMASASAALRSSSGLADAPPLTNRGGKSQGTELDQLESVKLVLDGNKILQVPMRRTWGGSAAMIDWVTITFGEETLDNGDDVPVTPEQVAIAVSNRLSGIFGYGITSKRESGVNFYRESYVIGDNYGFVGHGGQRGTVMVTINGTGCAAAQEGWEIRLKAFLEIAERSKITRIDLAHDDYTGKTYSVDRADEDHTNGLFNCGGRNPDCEYRGNWKNPNGKGRTFQVGNRKNGKYARIYEKGRELGDKNSEWVRVEVEFKSVDRHLPFQMLIEPGAYLADAYPAFNWISETQHRIKTTQKQKQAEIDKALNWLKTQCGAYLHHFSELLGRDELMAKVCRDDTLPNVFKVPHFAFAGKSIHEYETEKPRVDLNAAASAW